MAEGATEFFLADAWHQMFGQMSTPQSIALHNCSEFAVSREQVHRRSLDEYLRFHRWLLETNLTDSVSSRVFENLWPIIFGQSPEQYGLFLLIYSTWKGYAKYLFSCEKIDQCYDNVLNGSDRLRN